MARVMGEMKHDSIDSLMALAEPPVQGSRHQIVTHGDAAGTVEMGLRDYGLDFEVDYATGGSRMINGIQYTQTILAARYVFEGLIPGSDRKASLNMLHSTGQEVGWIFDESLLEMVCTNLFGSGTWNLARRKHTTKLDARVYVQQVIEAFLSRIGALQQRHERLAEYTVSQTQSAAVTLGLFRSGTLPVRMLKPVCENLFDAPAADVPEIEDTRGSLLAISHAATRVLRDEPQRRQTEMSGAVTQRLLAVAA